MQLEAGKIYAVLTGDVVGSTRIRGEERLELLEIMRETAILLREQFPLDVPLPLEIFRGDSWQVLVQNPENALKVGLFFRACIRMGMKDRQMDTRFSIGLGAIDLLPEDQVSSGDGEAFWLSGHGLERMPRNRRMVILLSANYADCQSDGADSILFLMDTLASRWTCKQAEAVVGALAGKTQERIAQTWAENPITQQAVAQHLDRAGWNAVEHGISFFERWLAMPKQLLLK
ncbi:MAG: hypothetical protein JXA97_00140 [Anaerolineales bacterium]|nr:hypothetical protein [Anaerolineales bacterium]